MHTRASVCICIDMQTYAHTHVYLSTWDDGEEEGQALRSLQLRYGKLKAAAVTPASPPAAGRVHEGNTREQSVEGGSSQGESAERAYDIVKISRKKLAAAAGRKAAGAAGAAVSSAHVSADVSGGVHV